MKSQLDIKTAEERVPSSGNAIKCEPGRSHLREEISELRALCSDLEYEKRLRIVRCSELEADLAKRDEPCVWMDYEGDECYEPEDVTASCGWQGYWFGGPPDHCPGCGHPVAAPDGKR